MRKLTLVHDRAWSSGHQRFKAYQAGFTGHREAELVVLDVAARDIKIERLRGPFGGTMTTRPWPRYIRAGIEGAERVLGSFD